MDSSKSIPTYAIVGSGKMAQHTAKYFDLLEIPFTTWSRRAEISLEDAIEPADVVLVLISDDAIEQFVQEKGLSDRHTVVHFSGAIVSERAVGMHPLSTFGPQLYDLETYKRIPFVCEKGSPDFRDIFPYLENPTFSIATDDKPLYHAVSVMAGNFTVHLWNKLFETFSTDLDLPAEIAIPYLEQVCRNIARNPGTESTGPIARRDRGTISKNLEALGTDPFGEVYRAMVTAVSPQPNHPQP
ncbi:MAG: DUF2520 domain-containing protein [Gemmatimonadota bacterium]|nr:DUF2520 domain-containing protein [Gemmatimonadota bacterium]